MSTSSLRKLIVNSAKPPKPYHHGNLRQELLDHAALLIEGDGLESLTLRKVAKGIGVSHMAPYRHFPDKAAIIAALAEQGFKALKRAMEEAAATEDAPKAQITALGLAYVQHSISHPAQFRAMFREHKGDFPDLDAASAASFGVLIGAMARGVDSDVLNQADPEQLALTAWTTVHGLATLLVDGFLRTEDSKIDDFQQALAITSQVLENLLQGLLKTGQ